MRCCECLRGWFDSLGRLVRPFDARLSVSPSRVRLPETRSWKSRAFVEGPFGPYRNGKQFYKRDESIQIIWSHLSARSTAWSWQQVLLKHFRWARPTRWSSGSGHVDWRRRLSASFFITYDVIIYILYAVCCVYDYLHILIACVSNVKHI